MKNIVLSATLLVFGMFLMLAFTNSTLTQEPWKVPAKYSKMVNPLDSDDADALKTGKRLYNKHCKSCHGSEGLGDGSKAAQLDTACGDFSTKEFKAQSDGDLFYKTKFGRDEMPSYEKKIPDDEDIWSIVLYMHEF